jgi:hypothetical protein
MLAAAADSSGHDTPGRAHGRIAGDDLGCCDGLGPLDVALPEQASANAASLAAGAVVGSSVF